MIPETCYFSARKIIQPYALLQATLNNRATVPPRHRAVNTTKQTAKPTDRRQEGKTA